MTISTASNNIAGLAIAGGILSAFFNSAIENLLNKFIDESQEVKIKAILAQASVSAIVLGLLLGIIFYVFALYGFRDKDLTPVELIAVFTTFFGLVYPLLSVTLRLIHSQLKKWSSNRV